MRLMHYFGTLFLFLVTACAAQPSVKSDSRALPNNAAEAEAAFTSSRWSRPGDRSYWCVTFGLWAMLGDLGRADGEARLIDWNAESRQFKIEVIRIDNIDIPAAGPARFVESEDQPQPEPPAGAVWIDRERVYMFEFELGDPADFAETASWNSPNASVFTKNGHPQLLWILQTGTTDGPTLRAVCMARRFKDRNDSVGVVTWGWKVDPRETSVSLARFRFIDGIDPSWTHIIEIAQTDKARQADNDKWTLSEPAAREVLEALGLPE